MLQQNRQQANNVRSQKQLLTKDCCILVQGAGHFLCYRYGGTCVSLAFVR